MDEREEKSETSSDDSVEIPVNVVDDEDQGQTEETPDEQSNGEDAPDTSESSESDGPEESDELFVEADDADVEVVDSEADGPDSDDPSELHDDARERIDELEARVEELQEERDHFEERMMRVAADLENFKKRAKRNEEELKKYGSKPLVSDLLPTIDNLERALEHAKSSEEANIIDGVEMVVRQLHQQLAKHGVEPFDATGEEFDPERHEAIQQVETSDHDSGEVLEQFQRGYKIHDRLLRPAMVSVAKQVESSEDDGESQGDQKTEEESDDASSE
jgi:molecular chaperone GrpE